MLREDPELVGYAPNFTIYDDDDSKRLVKSIMNDLDVDAKQFPLQAIRARISTAKNALVYPDEMEGTAQAPLDRKAAQVYRVLQTRLERANAMDFDDLLVRAYELLSGNPSTLSSYQERFRHISVDEYQDTNHVQYAITNLLAGRYRNLMEFAEGLLGDTPVVVVKSGVGKVDAAVCAQVLADRFGVTAIINTGVAGALDPRLEVGDIVVSIDALYHVQLGHPRHARRRHPRVLPAVPLRRAPLRPQGLAQRSCPQARRHVRR